MKRMSKIIDAEQHENTDGFKIAMTEEEKDQVAASTEDSDMDQMINVPDEKKNDQL